jgi:Holliday junction resolvasome RuvABC endonuclease subunit
MVVFGIDQSLTCTGLCVFEDNELIAFNLIHSNKEEDGLTRILDICTHIGELAQHKKPDVIAIEGLSYGSNSTSARILAALYYFIEYTARRYGCEFISYPPTKVKKFATKGNASKAEMILALPPEIHKMFVEAGFKKTTGLADLTDAFFIGSLYNYENAKDIDDEE